MQIKHRFVSEIEDDPQAAADGQVLPSHWNQTHEIKLAAGSLLGNSTDELNGAEEISVGDFLTLDQAVLDAKAWPTYAQTGATPQPVEGAVDAKPYLVYLDTGVEVQLHIWIPASGFGGV